MTYLFQLTGGILLALCCVRRATVYAGLLPEAASNGYQYNRPATSTKGVITNEGAFAGPTGVADDPNRRLGYPRDRPSERLTLPPFATTNPPGGAGNSGSFRDSASGSVNAFDFGSRSTNTYRGPGFPNDFPGGIGYNQPTPTNTFDLPNRYNNIPNNQPGRGFPSGFDGILDPYRNRYDLNDNRPRPYSFQYRVFDPPSGNDYGQQESSDGNVVQGEYRVLLPDSRTQIVKYTADDANGYNADVQYEGQAQYPNGFFPGIQAGARTETGSFPGGSLGDQFPGPGSEGPYQPSGFSGDTPYQGRRDGSGGGEGVGERRRERGRIGGGVRGGYNGGPIGNNDIFGSTGAGPGNQYLPPVGGYRK